jgi:transcriptional regulator with XRE-family HTH domain
MIDHDIGSRLVRAREQMGLSLADVRKLTKLPGNVLQAMERNEFARLPEGMYRKAYLRTLAAAVGLDPDEIGAAYDLLHQPPVVSPTGPPMAANVPDRWIEELTPSRRGTIVTLTVLGVLTAAWFALRPDSAPAVSRLGSARDESLVIRSPADAESAVSVPRARNLTAHVATTTPSVAVPVRVELITSGWCWVAAESDGERVWYGLIEPGRRVVFEAQRRISLRLGDAGSVRLSINNGPSRTPGAEGEVVELEVTPKDVQRVRDGAVEAESETDGPGGLSA